MCKLGRLPLVLTAVTVLASAVLLAGCQPTPQHVAPEPAVVASPRERAVMCDKCGTMWVMQSGRDFKGMVTYSRKPKMVCSDCTAAAYTFFTTGTLAPKCKSCGGTLEVCEGQRQ